MTWVQILDEAYYVSLHADGLEKSICSPPSKLFYKSMGRLCSLALVRQGSNQIYSTKKLTFCDTVPMVDRLGKYLSDVTVLLVDMLVFGDFSKTLKTIKMLKRAANSSRSKNWLNCLPCMMCQYYHFLNL